jgi:hypothetical protein
MLDRDEIIKMAREAGFAMNLIGNLVVPAPEYDATKYLKRFAALCFAAGQRDMQARAKAEAATVSMTDGYCWRTANDCCERIERLEIKEPS